MRNQFSRQLKEIISLSLDEALRLNSDAICTGHFLLVMIKGKHYSFNSVLNNMDIDWAGVEKEIEASIESGKHGQSESAGKAGIFSFFTKSPRSLSLTKTAETAVRESVVEAKREKSATVNGEHLFLSILNNTEDEYTKILNRYGLDYALVNVRFCQGILE